MNEIFLADFYAYQVHTCDCIIVFNEAYCVLLVCRASLQRLLSYTRRLGRNRR